MRTPPEPVAPAAIGPFVIERELGHGGMAVVYLARRRLGIGDLHKRFAVKVLHPHLRDPDQVAMFLDEARVALAIDHPNVVAVLDVGLAAGVPYIAMEHLRGRSLAAVGPALRGLGAHRLGCALQILAQAAAGLHAAHETRGVDGGALGIVHRDVTPANLHIGDDGRVRVVDFGIAASRGRLSSTRPDVIKGTFRYLAPEQLARSRPLDRRVDVWALGVVAWELLTGAALFRGEDDATTLWNVLYKEVPDLRALAPDVPAEAARAIMACLSREVAVRPVDLAGIERVLTRAALDAGVGSPSALAEHLAAVRDRDAEPAPAPPPASAGPTSAPTRALRARRAPTAVPTRWRMAAAALIALTGIAAAAGQISARSTRGAGTSRPVAAPVLAPAGPAAPARDLVPAAPQAARAVSSAPAGATVAVPRTAAPRTRSAARHRDGGRKVRIDTEVVRASTVAPTAEPPRPAPAPAPAPAAPPRADGPLLANPYRR